MIMLRKKAVKRAGLFGLLGFLGILMSGCGTPTPASHYSSKRSVLGPSNYPEPTTSQTNSPTSTAPKPQSAP